MQTVRVALFLILASVSMFTSAQEASPARQECSIERSHVEMRACLQVKAQTSANELGNVEANMRKSLAAWDQDPVYIKRSTSIFDSSAKQFTLFRTQQCEFIASLAAGGNGQGDLRLSCVSDLNEKRIAQIKQAQVHLQ